MRTEVLRVRSIQVTALLSQYDHSIEFSDDTPFVIIYGPNGIGKTKFLEVVDALTSLRSKTLRDIPFEIATINYVNDSILAVTRTVKESIGDEPPEILLQFSLTRKGEEPVKWDVDSKDDPRLEDWLEKETPYSPISATLWQDPSDGEIVEFSDLERRYQSHFNLKNRDRAPNPVTQALRDFVNTLNTHLIETQRLKIEANFPTPRSRMNPNIRRTSSTIVEYSASVKRLLSDVLTENSKIAQQLDRTFPSRMLNQKAEPKTSEQDIRQKYEEQNDFRKRLSQIALIGLEAELSLPTRKLAVYEVSMLNLHFQDVDSKLKSFENLLDKIALLEKIINSRLLGKSLHIDATTGIEVRRNSDGAALSLDSLSSGEQHEIILMYDLLFNVKQGSLVLIDEPEISLHVSWQLNFIGDVQEISQLAKFQFVVATHSPQIINSRMDRMKQFGSDDSDS